MPSPAEALAGALAARLDAVVPPPVRVRAEGAFVAVYVADEWWGSSIVHDPFDESESPADAAEWPPIERVASSASGVLSSVQDTVSVAFRTRWPTPPDGGMALPDARADGRRVHLWYGPDESAAVTTFAPLSLAELTRGAP